MLPGVRALMSTNAVTGQEQIELCLLGNVLATWLPLAQSHHATWVQPYCDEHCARVFANTKSDERLLMIVAWNMDPVESSLCMA